MDTVIRAFLSDTEREQARLEGVLLAVRTVQHELNNHLTITVGYAEMLTTDARLPDDARQLAREALEAAEQAVATVDRLRTITRLEETDHGGPGGPIIDLDRSAHEAAGPRGARRTMRRGGVRMTKHGEPLPINLPIPDPDPWDLGEGTDGPAGRAPTSAQGEESGEDPDA